MLLVPRFNPEKIERFVVGCAKAAAEALVPDFIGLPVKFCQIFYDCFYFLSLNDLIEDYKNSDHVPEGFEDGLIEKVLAAWSEVLPKGVALPDGIREQVRNMLLSLRAAQEAHQKGRDPSEALRQSLNRSTLGKGQQLPPAKFSPEQRAIGRMVAASMIGRQQAVKARVQAGMPAIRGYQMLRLLREGGFAKVYLALHEATGELRAVKFGTVDDPSRLEREMNILQSVDHRHLVRYYEHGKAHDKHGGKYYWIAMEYLGDKNLAELLAASENRLDLEQTLIIAEHILRGLAALHEKQFIHRDLKPDNVMVDRDFVVRLIDFGLAKPFQAEGRKSMGPSVAGDLIGTPRYMSPEQVRGETNLTFATDVWSFGVILHELVVGEPLFRATNIMTLGNEILTKKLTFDDERIPAELRPVLLGCLKNLPSERYRDADLVLKKFNAAAEGLRRRKNHERYLPVWLEVFEKRLLEAFVAEYHGPFDEKTVSMFTEFAARHGISDLDPIALARVLPPTLAAQRAAESAGRQVAQAKAALTRELEKLTSDQISQRNSDIKELEEICVQAIDNVTVQIRRELADEVKKWEQLQADAREREKQQHQAARQLQREAEARPQISEGPSIPEEFRW